MAAVQLAVKAMVTEKRSITPEEAKNAMHDIMSGAASDAQRGAFLSCLQVI